MNQKSLDKLEFNQIRKMLADFACTNQGKERANLLVPMKQKAEIEKAQTQTTEALTLLYRLGNLPMLKIEDITIHLKQLEHQNSLNSKQLLDLAQILQLAQDLKQYFDKETIEVSDFPNIFHFFENLYSNPSIVKAIKTAIIDENTIDDNASTTLKNIRNHIRKKETEIKHKLNSFLHSKYIQEPIITIRNGRFVVPVKNEYRSEVKGFVHDISTSGSTAFIEPIAIFDMNNEISKLKEEENLEIEKILMQLSSLLFPQIENLKNTVNLIGILDFLFAKAKFSREFECTQPIISEEKSIHLIDCYHPLLPRQTAVKNTIEIGTDYTSLIITGPNTGGKTVLLKTVGLLIAMAMSGLHIPAKSGSSLFVFDEIFADIGDDQSISDSLSTFSAHITNIVSILKNATENSLVLIDELGSGTDPVEGSCLAISILENLKERNILSFITTHYHEIKNYAFVTDGFKNASVAFDFDTLSPTYKLLIGVPGRSNAFIISKKLGISDSIINRAKELAQEDTTNVEDLLNQIYEDKRVLDAEKSKIEANLAQIEALKISYEEKYNVLEAKKSEILENAKQKARQILLDAKEETNFMIHELEDKANTKQANQIRNKLNQKIENLSTEKSTQAVQKPLQKSDIKIGITVEIPSLHQVGTILSTPTKDDMVQVQIGSLKTYFKISDLAYTDAKPKLTEPAKNKQKRDFKVSSISPEINVIGQTVEDACFVIDKYLDNCVLNGLLTVRIVHGKGTGALKKGIHQFLKKHPHVKSFRIGTFGEGEDGVTIAELK